LESIKKILETFETISLDEMDNVKLMNRTDTKFIFTTDKLPGLLRKATDHYKVLTINNKRLFFYRSRYLDTPDSQMYLEHHNRNMNRYKVRFREYVDSDTRFLEIKFKNNKGRTNKVRIKRKKIEEDISKKSKKFINTNTPYNSKKLETKLWSNFSRLTLVQKKLNERITIDINLEFSEGSNVHRLPFLVITEVKRSRFSGHSEFINLLNEERIKPIGISKYCIGMILLNKNLKYNRFKRKLLTLNKMSHDYRNFSPGN
jgi:hypothetical protein